jgi:hypothetical protein
MIRNPIIRILLVLCVAASIPAKVVQASSGDEWTAVAVGVDYQQFNLSDPNHVYVTRMERSNPDVILESSVGSGELASGRETVSSMAKRYDDSLSAWGGAWGQREHVVAAINGDYFNPGTGYPQNGMIHAGWYDKRYNDYEGWSGFVWSSDRDIFIGACVMTDPARQYITFGDGTTTQQIDELNAPRVAGHLTLYTPDYASTTLTDGSGVEVVVSLNQPVTVTPGPHKVMGQVIDIRDSSGSTPIAFDQVILSATGGARDTLLAHIQLGDMIGITQEITSLDNNCKPTSGLDFTTAYAAIGGAFTFLKDGQAQHLDVIGATARAPRTAIAYNDQYIYFIVVDGRAPGVSVGMSLDEVAVFARDTLGATWGIAQDGGGSSTMVVQGTTVNRPSDKCNVSGSGDQDKNKIFLPDVTKSKYYKPAGPGTVETSVNLGANSGAAQCERPVANGMMMVTLQPQGYSTAFIPGDNTLTLYQTDLSLGPGSNYGTLLTIPAHESVSIQQHGNGLDGIQAKGTNWWYVTYKGAFGWVPETNLVPPAVTQIESIPVSASGSPRPIPRTIFLPQIMTGGGAAADPRVLEHGRTP